MKTRILYFMATVVFMMITIHCTDDTVDDIYNDTGGGEVEEINTLAGTWDLVYVSEEEMKGYVVFKYKGLLDVYVGCNLLGLQYKINQADHTLSFDIEEVKSTKKSCSTDDDEVFLKILSKVTRYEEPSENTLVLLQDDVILIELKR